MTRLQGYIPKALVLALAWIAAGAWPAWRLSGERGLWGFVVGVAAALAGALLGRLPHRFLGRGPGALVGAALAGVGIRLLATLALAGIVLLTTSFPREPVAIGLVLTYLSLLALEVRDLVLLGRAAEDLERTSRQGSDGAPTR